MEGGCREGVPLNSFALVAYIPEPIAGLVDSLRSELDTDRRRVRAHVTVLPPRPINGDAGEAIAELAGRLREFRPFQVILGDVLLFPSTSVVYLSLAYGASDLQRLHRATNAGMTYCPAAYNYHPHVTLAQGVPYERLNEALRRASAIWRDYGGPREFVVDRLVFVQNTEADRWEDRAEFQLQEMVPA
jgi:2'-5' RNA ligase